MQADILAALVLGTGATLLIDMWNLALRQTIGIRSLDYCLLGRWVLHMPAAFRHRSIAAAATRRGECAAGWIAHFAIGISLALAFLLLVHREWLAQPTPLPALLYGIATAVLPLFVLQPALGLGIASSRAAKPLQARVKSVATHAIYGLGLYLTALAMISIMPR